MVKNCLAFKSQGMKVPKNDENTPEMKEISCVLPDSAFRRFCRGQVTQHDVNELILQMCVRTISKMLVCVVVGCFKRCPRDAKRGANFHRLPLGNESPKKQWLLKSKELIFPKQSLMACFFGPITLNQSVSRYTVGSNLFLVVVGGCRKHYPCNMFA